MGERIQCLVRRFPIYLVLHDLVLHVPWLRDRSYLDRYSWIGAAKSIVHHFARRGSAFDNTVVHRGRDERAVLERLFAQGDGNRDASV